MVLKGILILLPVFLLFACGGGEAELKQREKAEEHMEPMTVDEAKELFIRHCESCHGLDGTKQAAGAADLSKTKKSDEEIRQMILKGNDKGMMPYDELLTDREETGLVEFVKTLQQNK